MLLHAYFEVRTTRGSASEMTGVYYTLQHLMFVRNFRYGSPSTVPGQVLGQTRYSVTRL
jgi:hypothetical protein